MESIRIQSVALLMIFSASLILGKEGIESEKDKIITENSRDEISKAQNEELEIRTRRSERTVKSEEEARKSLEEQMKEMQEKLTSLFNFKNSVENITQNYKNLSSSAMSIIVLSGLRGLENVVSNLTAKMSTIENNLSRLENEIKDIAHLSKLNATLPNIKNFTKTESQIVKIEIVPHVRQLDGNVPECESKYSQQYVPCKEGWFLYGDKCYKWFPERRQWREASQGCKNEGGHLATVSSHEIQEFLSIFMLLRERAAAWIGGSDLESESNFTWEDGSPFIYTEWDPEQPDNRANVEHCLHMLFGARPRSNARELGYWNDVDCNAEQPYICQLDENKDGKELSPDPRFCSINEGGGFKYREYCFHIVRTRKSWEEAQKHCEENFNGNLVTILDTEVEMFLNYISSDVNEDFWIGIRRQDKSIQKWKSGWPIVHDRLNRNLKEFPEGTCVLRSKNQFWTITECFREFPFICETTKTAAPVLKNVPEGWQCPPNSQDWIDLEGESCYFFGTNRNFNWYEANNDCERKGGKLASITSKEEDMILLHFVLKITQSFRNNRAFIGLQRRKSNEHLFEWVDGSTLEYTNWRNGEPSNVEEECVEMNIHSSEYYYSWNDIRCNNIRSASYICSAKKAPPRPMK